MNIEHDTWPLPNLKEITAREFWHHMTIWGCPKSTYVQKQSDGKGSWFSPTIFEAHHGELAGGGFVVLAYYSGPKNGEVEYFTWQECVHDFEHKSGGNCYHIHSSE
jgi:hypothetical protein